MQIEGRLQIDLYPQAGQGHAVSIRSTRPLQAARIFEGKSVPEVLMQLPLLFSICGVAQATAATRAFKQALGRRETGTTDRARALLVDMESAREHLWRILLDWPTLLNEAVDARRAAAIQPLLPALRQALFGQADAFALETPAQVDMSAVTTVIERLEQLLAEQVFDGSADAWRAMTTKTALHDWAHSADSVAARLLRQVIVRDWQAVAACDVAPLPALPPARLNAQLATGDAETFIAAPRWETRPRETSALTRQADHGLTRALREHYGNGLLTRLTARLLALASIPGDMRRLLAGLDDSPVDGTDGALAGGIGIGQVEAARGRLVHRVELADTRVRRYQILAPTEWNFHPEGVVAQGLARLPMADKETLREQAALLINAVDPCVGYALELH